jgi:hypothetical protein
LIDNDGLGCDSANGEGTSTPEPKIICTQEISYGQGPCDEFYLPPDENGQCPNGSRFVDERTIIVVAALVAAIIL